MLHPYTRLFILPSAPTSDEDNTEGYEIGDVVHVPGGSIYDCRDASTGAAVWQERGAGASEPTADAHIADTTAAHAASAIGNTPAGNIASTDVQAALNELDSEKSGTGHTHAYLASGDAAGGDLGGTLPNPTVLKASTSFGLTGVISPAALTGNVNDWNPTGLSAASVINVNDDGSPHTITGLAGGVAGRIIVIRNGGTSMLTLGAGSTSSSAANRFSFMEDKGLDVEDAVIVRHDGSSWRAIATSFPSVRNGNFHAHVSGAGAQIDHVNLANKGTNTHAQIDDILATGWLPRSEAWTRTGNHTFTVSGDLMATFRKGAKVRYKDGGSYEYGVIDSSVYSSPNTTVTLLTNSDYAMAAATITDKYISYIETPEGFPDYFNYTVTWGGSGGAPSLGNGSLAGKWKTKGKEISFQIYLVMGSTTTFGSGLWNFNLPATATSGSTGYEIGPVYVLDFGTMNYYGFWYLAGTTTISCLRDNTATPFTPTVPHTWATNDILSIKGVYQY